MSVADASGPAGRPTGAGGLGADGLWLVTPPTSDPEPETPGGPGRPVLERVSVSTDQTGSAAEVAVRVGRDERTGTACGASTPAGRPRVVAEATVQALHDLLAGGCGVESAQVLPAGSREVAVVVLAVPVPRLGELLLTGSALVRSYPDDAVVRAVLDALNRHLTP